jgi:large subunit ribosomal protein L5
MVEQQVVKQQTVMIEGNLRQLFYRDILPTLRSELKLTNDLQVPRPDRAVVQIGIGKLVSQNPETKDRVIEEAVFALSQITGQKPIVVTAKKSVAGFKLRQGQPVAVLVTLRRSRLFDFIERLLTYILPRFRDFKGINPARTDRSGNLNLGFSELSVFPEAISDKIKTNFGLQITLIGTGASKEHNLKLWQALGFPFEK